MSVWDVLGVLEESEPDVRLDQKGEVRARRGKKVLIVRVIHREQGYYVLGVSRASA